jgi:hypothetical protein
MTPSTLSCKFLKPNGLLIYVQCDPKLWGSQVPVCENAMGVENVIHFLKIRWNPKIGGIIEGQEGGF